MRMHQHFGNFVCLGEEVDPFANTKRLLEKGIINVPRGEEIGVPQEKIDEWFKIWQEQYRQADLAFRAENPGYYDSLDDATRHRAITGIYILRFPASDNFIYMGDWDWVLKRRIEQYRLDQSNKFTDVMMMQADTLMASARREAVALGRQKLDEILAQKGHLLSESEKKLLEKFFLYQFDTPTTAQENAEVQAILDRIYKAETVEKTYTIQPWNPNTGIPTDAKIFVKTDWETEQDQLKRDIAIKDSQYVSPLETAFMKAGTSIQQDVQTISTQVEKKPNLLLYAALGLIALKLLRR